MKAKNKILWITETAVMLASLIALQAVTKPFGQLITGACVNTILAVTVLLCGLTSGVTVAVISPVCAYLLGIAPQILTVPAIMLGNSLFVLLLKILMGSQIWRKIVAWLGAAAAKFAVMHIIVVHIICGVASSSLLESGMLKLPMLQALPATFSFPQLITALIGGAIAILIAPVLKKALHKN